MTSAVPDRMRAMTGRDAHEEHRVASNLELLFDLTFVVAFGFAGNELAHAIAGGHAGAGVLAYAMAMCAVIWAWINFTWFSSAFDTDDWAFRLMTMVQMVGVLLLTLGIPQLFASLEEGDHLSISVIVLGYVVMRVSMIGQWLRAARQAPDYAPTCRSYAMWVGIAQVGWVVMIFLPVHLVGALVCFAVLFALEISAPAIAERRTPTPWHAHHVAERFGLLAIITLGEGVVGSLAALSAVIDSDGWTWQVAAVGLAGVGLTFAIWWCYFVLPSAEVIEVYRAARAFVWAYGHIVMFGAIAAVGAGLHVAALRIEALHAEATHAGEGEHVVSVTTVLLSVAVPVAVFTVLLYGLYAWLVGAFDPFHAWLLAGAAVFLVLPLLMAQAEVPMPVCLLVMVLSPVVTVVGFELVGHRHREEAVSRIQASANGS